MQHAFHPILLFKSKFMFHKILRTKLIAAFFVSGCGFISAHPIEPVAAADSKLRNEIALFKALRLAAAGHGRPCRTGAVDEAQHLLILQLIHKRTVAPD